MLFNAIPLKTLAVFCKSLATMLHSGVPLLKALDTLARKTGSARCRHNIAEVCDAVKQGVDIAAAMRDRNGYFPELTVDMVAVGEQTGQLPEVLDGLADHYENNVRLKRTFITMITWPVIQLTAAILIVAGLIWILGIIASGRGGEPIDMLGWGLTGTSGAVKWLALSFGSIFGLMALYYIIARVFRQQRVLDRLLLLVPVVGGCLRSFAIARFSWAFAMTQQTGMGIAQCLDASFKATGNGAFAGASQHVQQLVLAGEELSVALDQSRLFPEEYLQIVQVAETSGAVPETLARLSPQFEDQARRSLSLLATTAAWGIWLVVAVLIIYIIFSIFMQYVGAINDAASGTF
ncbi:MAG: type II secretion system F family protein [Planctomycetaceae bacterium]